MSSAGKRDAYHHGNLREALVEAAIELLVDEGLAALSLRAVARRAGVSHTAPYRHFADKAELLAAVAVEGFRSLRAALERAMQGLSEPRDRLRDSGRAYVAFALAHPAHYRVMFGPDLDKAAHAELGAVALATFEVFVAAVTDAVAPDVAPMDAAVFLWAEVHGLSLLALDGQLAVAGDDPAALMERVGALCSRAVT